ncbi:MAG: hypothetical protein ACRDAQ_06290 [Cetobacterium sp.]
MASEIPEIIMTNTKLLLMRRGFTNIEYLEESDCGQKPRLVARKSEEDGADDTTVFFIVPTKVTIHVIKAIISMVKTPNAIIMYNQALTSDAKQSISSGSYVVSFEIFSFDEMSYDPIAAVPVHRKILERPTEWSKLPYILTTDFISRYFGFKHGDTIAIEEEGYISYRKCV